MLRMLAILGVIGGAGAAAAGLFRPNRAGRVAFEVQKRAHIENYREHHHPPAVHYHEHPHVTHNRRQGADKMMGEWDHLTAIHAHEHNHPELGHSHLPHEDAEHEHLGEAHIHDHARPAESPG